MAIEPAAVMMKKALLLHKNPWAIAALSLLLSRSSQSKGIPSRPKCYLLSPHSTTTTASKFLDGTTIPD
jgi:hypothetical protein